jgi:putative phosphoesterase
LAEIVLLRIALIADIHSNLLALEAVLDTLRKKNVQKVLNAGDIIGYGPRPNEVVDLVRRAGLLSIRGNHDHAILVGEYGWFNESAAATAKWTAEIIEDSNLEYLNRLKREEVIRIDGKVIGMFHGSPDDPDEYVLDASRGGELLQNSNYDVIFCGHTHSPVQVRIGKRLFINPGSVGQPRDGNPDASFSILDLDTMESETVRVGYDVSAVQGDMLDKGLPRFLSSRLSEGR